jgi:DNA-binding beta-propeller fold protein YncE
MTASSLGSGNSHAVLLGVSKYADPAFIDIPAVVNSIEAFKRSLEDKSICAWPMRSISTVNNPANVDAATRAVKTKAELTTETFLFYFVGHGILSQRGELALVLRNTSSDRPYYTSLPWSWVAEIIRSSPAARKIVILDCCYAGQAIETLNGPELADLAYIRGAYTLTATHRNVTAHAPVGRTDKCTTFTGELVDILRTGVPDAGEFLTLGDIFPVLTSRMRSLGMPLPNQRSVESADRLIFARNTAIDDRAPANITKLKEATEPSPTTSPSQPHSISETYVVPEMEMRPSVKQVEEVSEGSGSSPRIFIPQRQLHLILMRRWQLLLIIIISLTSILTYGNVTHAVQGLVSKPKHTPRASAHNSATSKPGQSSLTPSSESQPASGLIKEAFSVNLKASPNAIALSSLHNSAYIENTSDQMDGDISVIDLASKSVIKDIPLGGSAYQDTISLSPDQHLLYVPAGADVKVIDTARRAIVKTLKADGPGIFSTFLAPRGDLLWVSYTQYIAVVRVSNDSIAHYIPLTNGQGSPNNPATDIRFSADEKTAYILQDDAISVMDVATYKVVKKFKYKNGLSLVLNGSKMYVGGFTEDDSLNAGRVATLDLSSGRVLHSETFSPGRARHLVLAPDKRHLYATDPEGGAIYVFDTVTGRAVDTIMATGDFPWDLAVTADGSTLLVTQSSENAVTAFRES